MIRSTASIRSSGVARLVPALGMLLAWAPVAAGQTKATRPSAWLVRPQEVAAKITQWAKEHPQIVSLDPQKTLGGNTAYAVTVTDPRFPDQDKAKVLFAQPHAHEPAATAGMMNLLAQLIEGRELDGRNAAIDRQTILRRSALTFIPDGNPDGRSRAPVQWWDGSRYSNKEFLDIAFGRTAGGERCKRLGRWSSKDQQPALLGIVYEQINDHEFVEPNRDLESSYFKLILRARKQRDYGLHVDLHQTEFEKSPYQAMVILPFSQKDLPPRIRKANVEAASAVLKAWQRIGAKAMPDARPLGYGEDQIQYFRRCWKEINEKTPEITIEIQNNSPRTPPDVQRKLMEAAIRAAIDWAARADPLAAPRAP
jgi:hypothetical protein